MQVEAVRELNWYKDIKYPTESKIYKFILLLTFITFNNYLQYFQCLKT